MLIRIALVVFSLVIIAFTILDIYHRYYYFLGFDVVMAALVVVMFKLLGDFESGKHIYK